MKFVCAAFCFILMAAFSQAAEFSAPGQKIILQKRAPEYRTGENFRPRASGVVIMMSDKGLQVISPFAPASLGVGQKVLTQTASLDTRAGNSKDDVKAFGGITLIGFEF